MPIMLLVYGSFLPVPYLFQHRCVMDQAALVGTAYITRVMDNRPSLTQWARVFAY